MARRPRISRKRINDLLEPYSERLRLAFMAAVQDIRDNAQYQRVVQALAANDVEGALAALNIDQSAFLPVDIAVREAYQAGGAQAIASLGTVRDAAGAALVIRFDGRNPVAEQYLTQYAGDLITAITQDQLTMARNHMQAGLAAGQGPASVALDIVGRIDRRTGQRAGGVLGLTDSQAQIVRNAREQLVSGDLRGYLMREQRDKRFDRAVLAAIQNGKPLDASAISRMVTSYENNLLRLRGETIGRTETMKALHSAQHHGLQQVAQRAGIAPQQIRRIWRTASDSRVRDSHVAMNGQSVGLDEPFVTGNGARLMYPGDPNGPSGDVINCRCDVETRIDYLSNIGPRR